MLLADIGGFYFILTSLAAVFLNIAVNFNKSANLLALDLYKTSSPKWGAKELSRRGVMVLDPGNPTKSCTQFLQSYLPASCISSTAKCCLCMKWLRPSHQDTLYGKARERVGKETDIVSVIRSIRLF